MKCVAYCSVFVFRQQAAVILVITGIDRKSSKEHMHV